MIFQHTFDKVMAREKTQTRRIKKPGEFYWYDFATLEGGHHGVFADLNNDHNEARSVYQCKKTYAIQPGRGKLAVGRIRITNIRREDVRNISHEDALAEGFPSRLDFLAVWIGFYDKGIWLNRVDIPQRDMQAGDWYLHCTERGKKWYQDSASEAFIWEKIWKRPAERYQAWVLEFELVTAEEAG